MRVCTIIARNYWAHARVLARSLSEHEPDAHLTVLVLDADAETLRCANREAFDIRTTTQIGIDRGELERMAGIYDVLELSTALKPWLLRSLLAEDPSPVVYLDPDIEVFAPIRQLSDAAASHGIVLTPHTLSPLPLDEYGPNELTILQSGIYNLGFIGVGSRSVPFLEWWAERLRRDCLISKPEGLFVDQRWVDLVPNYFAPHILREPGWNVAYWNLPARHLGRSDAGYLVNGEPLRFFHFSGFDPSRPDRLSFYQGENPRIRLDEQPILDELCRRYADELVRSGHRAWTRIPCPFDRAASGLRLDRRARRIYRDELVRSERGHGRPPPNPFSTRDPDAFDRWLNERAGPHEITRYLRAFYYERPDVQAAFPDIDGADARLFVDWIRSEAAMHEQIPERLVPRPAHHAEVGGVNLAGYLAAENGVGEGARLLATSFDAADVPYALHPYHNTRSRQEAEVDAAADVVYDLNAICINADQLPTFLEDAADLCPLGRYRIGVWSWELDVMPGSMAASALHVDEIWMPSEHCARGVRPLTDRPVFVLPHAVVRPPVRPISRARLGLPEGFLFLFCFDFDSVIERKNPIGAIEAFRRAFPSPCGPQLVLKTVRGEAHPEEFARLRGAAAGRPDIHVIDGYLEASDQHRLISACDSYVSLHRAEGFGLTIAEAMSLGKPVVATAYSGNLEFTDETNSWLIPYSLVSVPEGCDPYPPGAQWAEPDLDAAAAAMREIVADPNDAHERGARAAADIARLHGPQSRVPFIVERLEAIAQKRLSTAAKTGNVRPWTSVESAMHYVAAGPDVGSPTRYGFFGRLARRFVMRVMRHFSEHQDRLHATLVESVRELQERLAAESAAVRELEAKLREVGAPESDVAAADEDSAVTRLRERDARDPDASEGSSVRSLRERRG